MKSMQKTRIKGITELSNIPNGLELQFHRLAVATGILVDMSGDTRGRFHKGVDHVGVVTCDWDINDVFNDSTTHKRLTAPSHDAG